MHWKLDIDEQYEEVEINIHAPKLTDNISKLINFMNQLSHTLSIEKNDEHNKVDILSIIYIENIERMTFIYTKTKIYEDNRPLYELEKKLKQFEFIQINKQTLVSPKYIQSVKALFNSRYELLMTSGEKLIVTRHYRKIFKELFKKGGIYDA